jgi:hypothetical protein
MHATPLQPLFYRSCAIPIWEYEIGAEIALPRFVACVQMVTSQAHKSAPTKENSDAFDGANVTVLVGVEAPTVQGPNGPNLINPSQCDYVFISESISTFASNLHVRKGSNVRRRA